MITSLKSWSPPWVRSSQESVALPSLWTVARIWSYPSGFAVTVEKNASGPRSSRFCGLEARKSWLCCSPLTFAHLRRRLDGIVTVSEEEIAAATARLVRDVRLVVEPSGAVTTAARMFHAAELPAGRTVAVVSGGNVDPAVLAAAATPARGGVTGSAAGAVAYGARAATTGRAERGQSRPTSGWRRRCSPRVGACAPLAVFASRTSTHLLALRFTRSPAALRVNRWAAVPLQVYELDLVPLAVPAAGRVHALAHRADRAVGGEGPLLGGGAVAVPDLQLGAVDRVGAGDVDAATAAARPERSVPVRRVAAAGVGVDPDVVDQHLLRERGAAVRVAGPVAADRHVQDHEERVVEDPAVAAELGRGRRGGTAMPSTYQMIEFGLPVHRVGVEGVGQRRADGVPAP